MKSLHQSVDQDAGLRSLDAEPQALKRAVIVSNALRIMARRAARVGTRPSWREAASQRWSNFSIGIVFGFIGVVLLPALLAGVYFCIIASQQYISETRFAVRAASSTNDLLGGLGMSASTQRTEDSFVVADYIRSRRMFEDLDKDLDLKRRYALRTADFIARLDLTDPIEDMVRYWKSRVDVQIDRNSWVVSVFVRAFTPEDALVIAQGIANRSEKLINELSDRSRQDALKQAQTELQIAERGLQLTIENMRRTRNEQGILDATVAAEATTQVIGELRAKLLTLEGQYDVQRGVLSPTALQMKMLASQIESIRQQIGVLERSIGSIDGIATLSDTQSQLERRAMERKIAEQLYSSAVGTFEQARLDQATKQVYLMTFIPPRLAEEALYPRRLLFWTIIVAAGLAIWGCGTGIAVMVRDHIAV